MNRSVLRSHWSIIATVAAITALGAWLRFTDIGTESLWTDELYSLHWASKSVAQIFANASSDVHPPTYYLALHYWIQAFGTSEAALRGLSALFGVLAIPLMYLLGREIAPKPHHETTGIVAALLLAVSHFHVYYASEARNYTLTVLCAVWSMLAFVQWNIQREKEDDAKDWRRPLYFKPLHYVLATIALMHTHLFALFVVVAQNVFVASLIILQREKFQRIWKEWFGLQVALLVLFAPWARILLHQILSVNKQGFWIEQPTWFTLAETAAEYAGGFWLLALFAVLVGWTLVMMRRTGLSSVVWMLVLWLAMPIAIPFAKSMMSKPAVYYIKYTIPVLPAFVLLAALGWAHIPSRFVRTWMLIAVLALSLAAVKEEWAMPNVTTLQERHLEKERWREASQILDSAANRDEVVFVHQWYYEWALDYYCHAPHRVAAVPTQFLKLNEPVVARLVDNTFDQVRRQPKRVWLVLAQRDGKWSLIQQDLERRGYRCCEERVLSSSYRKYFVKDEYFADTPEPQTVISLVKNYWTPHIRLLRFERE